MRKRLEVYHTQTEPIIDYYRAQGLVVTISALGKVTEVTEARDGRAEEAREGLSGTRSTFSAAAVSDGRRGRTVEQES